MFSKALTWVSRAKFLNIFQTPEALEFSAAMRLRALSVIPSLALMFLLCEGEIAEMCRR